MTALTFLLCFYCAIIGTALWIAFFVTLWYIVYGWKNRYNLSVPRIVIDKVDKHSRVDSKSMLLDDNKKTPMMISDKEIKTKILDMEMV